MESVQMAQQENWRAALLAKFAKERGAQKKLARVIGCSESHLSLVLKGKRGVSYTLGKAISSATGVPVDDVMGPPPSEAAE